jgi:hypothetical protein
MSIIFEVIYCSSIRLNPLVGSNDHIYSLVYVKELGISPRKRIFLASIGSQKSTKIFFSVISRINFTIGVCFLSGRNHISIFYSDQLGLFERKFTQISELVIHRKAVMQI